MSKKKMTATMKNSAGALEMVSTGTGLGIGDNAGIATLLFFGAHGFGENSCYPQAATYCGFLTDIIRFKAKASCRELELPYRLSLADARRIASNRQEGTGFPSAVDEIKAGAMALRQLGAANKTISDWEKHCTNVYEAAQVSYMTQFGVDAH